uniref:uncharacterized protein n=1 Tax=Myxine glutinosa TaxID=7769 RepID=UPI00358EF955
MLAFSGIFSKSKRKPNKLWTDEGTEFHNKIFIKFLNGEGVKLYSTFNERKAVVIERFNRTLKERLYKKFTQLGSQQWGIYPYDYMDSFDRFKETQLPSKENFYNELNKKYHDLYLKTDVLLLADVFETFRMVCHNNNSYGLDPAHYYTAPGLAWSAMLKMTKQNLELISDVDMLLMLEKAKRGGISQVCSKRYAKANNKYLPNYDAKEDSSYLMYYDANNLYGWTMSQSLPYRKLKWVKEKDYEKVLQDIEISTQGKLDKAKVGYYFEVYLKYPEELHNKHKDLPYAPVKESPRK